MCLGRNPGWDRSHQRARGNRRLRSARHASPWYFSDPIKKGGPDDSLGWFGGLFRRLPQGPSPAAPEIEYGHTIQHTRAARMRNRGSSPRKRHFVRHPLRGRTDADRCRNHQFTWDARTQALHVVGDAHEWQAHGRRWGVRKEAQEDPPSGRRPRTHTTRRGAQDWLRADDPPPKPHGPRVQVSAMPKSRPERATKRHSFHLDSPIILNIWPVPGSQARALRKAAWCYHSKSSAVSKFAMLPPHRARSSLPIPRRSPLHRRSHRHQCQRIAELSLRQHGPPHPRVVGRAHGWPRRMLSPRRQNRISPCLLFRRPMRSRTLAATASRRRIFTNKSLARDERSNIGAAFNNLQSKSARRYSA
jgi:hypothetical protein